MAAYFASFSSFPFIYGHLMEEQSPLVLLVFLNYAHHDLLKYNGNEHHKVASSNLSVVQTSFLNQIHSNIQLLT